MRNDWIEERLQELRAQGVKKNKAGLARALGITAPRISEMAGGRRGVKGREVGIIAEYLEWPNGKVVGLLAPHEPDAVELSAVMVIGAVEAGVWADAIEWPVEDWRPAPVAADRRYARLRQFGLEVRGPSMNEIYPEGAVVICVKTQDIGREPRPGERVVVHRSNSRGMEATLKELRRDDDGVFWLWPRSRHPSFQQPWRLTDGASSEEDSVAVVAIVVGSYRPE